jgi:hypothetical protein
MNSDPEIQSIRELAFRLWQQRGRPDGSALEDWLEAEKQLGNGDTSGSSQAALDQALSDSFPASDPPAVHLKDDPPANARTRVLARGAQQAKLAGKH